MEEKTFHQSFTELAVWQAGRLLQIEIENLLKKFSAEEEFRMTDQIISSARSINHNISEGHGRFRHAVL